MRIHNEILGTFPRHPVIPALVSAIRSIPVSALPYDKVIAINEIVAQQLHIASTSAMANLAVFQGMSITYAIIHHITCIMWGR